MTGASQPPQTWRDRAGTIVLSPADPHGQPIATPADRRWLWRVARQLTVTAPDAEVRQLAADLHRYLSETCEHHWLSHAAGEYLPAHRQCLWCSKITAPAGPGATENSSGGPVPDGDGDGDGEREHPR